MSQNALNKILHVVALKVLHGTANNIAESGYYCIVADVSTDVSNIGQLVICIHWVDKEMMVCKEYIGLMPVAQTNEYTIFIYNKDMLLRMNLRI